MAAMVLGISLAATGAVAFATPAPAQADDGAPSVDALSAIQDAAPGVLNDVASVATTADGDVAISAATSSTTITIPTDPSDGITIEGTMSTPVTSVSVDLPFAGEANRAKVEAPGIVSFDNGNGSTTVPVVKSDGSLQISTIINGASAPSEYPYALDVPAGGRLASLDNGAAVVLDDQANPVTYIPTPWAKDSSGVAVPTHFVVAGNTLTQVVDTSSAEIVFPVVADPQFLWYSGLPAVKLNKAETKAATNMTGAARACGYVIQYTGPLGGVICGANILSIVYNSISNVSKNRCDLMLIGPGVVSTTYYTGGYCR